MNPFPHDVFTEPSKAVAKALREFGLNYVEHPNLPPFWTRDPSELAPFYAPSVVKVRHGFQMHGVIGIWIAAFENWWSEVLKVAPPSEGAADGFLLSLYVTNLPALMLTPTFSTESDLADVPKWTAKILLETEALPKSWTDLEAVAHSGQMLGLPLRLFWGHPVKQLAFSNWLHRNSATQIELDRPVLSRLAPFESAFAQLSGAQSQR